MMFSLRVVVSPPLVCVLLALVANCGDSGHSLGNTHASTGGTTGTGGMTGAGGVPGSGGTTGTGGVSTGGTATGGGAGSGAGGNGGDVGILDARADTSLISDVALAPDAGKDVATVDVFAVPPCPSSPPGTGGPCIAGQSACFYDDCPATGRTQATCTSGKWVVETGACGTVTCQGVGTGSTCASGQVCLVHAGGALLVSCIANYCGTGAASADCSDFTLGCNPLYSLTSGVTYYCNTCTQETCA